MTPTMVIGGANSTIPRHLLAETVERMPDAGLVTRRSPSWCPQ
ncbi:hypothetical protein [Phytohabitans suffuscus]|nr:hypothetical protein [Phytohabitans suffuscus]